MSQVTIDELWVKYGAVSAVKGVSFEVPSGEIFGFISPNGAGKSSTLRVIATLQKASSGRVAINDVDVRRFPQEIRRRIGYVPDEFGVYEDLTVYEYMHFFAAAYDTPNRQRHIDELLKLTDLDHKCNAQVDSLSRGMKQRLALARVLIHEPTVLLLDEPASGLDPRARIEVRELLKELQRMGKTILISSHILHELAELCTRIGIIEQGRMVAEGALSEIYQQLDVNRVVHVQLSDPTESEVRALRSITGVTQLERYSDRLSFHIDEQLLPAEQLLLEIQKCGGRVRMFQPEAMDMETVFMKLTEGRTS